MNKTLGFIITHGNLAEELNIVAQKLLPNPIKVLAFSNQKDTIEKIRQDALSIINNHKPEKLIVFVDLLGGSCWHAAMGLKKEFENTFIFTGVNIPMLISFSANYARMDWDDLLVKIEEDSKKAIRVIK